MLLVNDDQAKVFKFDAFLDQFMRADYDVYLAIGQPCQRLGLFPGRTETGQLRDFNRPFLRNQPETVRKILEMLFSQQGGGDEYSYLFAVGDSDKGGAQRDLSLAEPNIAADQP